MSDLLADTHAVVWFLFGPARLSTGADAAMTAASRGGKIFLSAITLVELNYLSGKKSFPYVGVMPRLVSLVSDPLEPLELLPLTLAVALAMDRVPRDEIPDMPDRIVAATAVAHRLPVVSADSHLRGSASLGAIVSVIW